MRAILTCMHKYTPYGAQYYAPILDSYIKMLERYRNEFDRAYILDSNWGVTDVPNWISVIKVNPHLRYYVAYKSVLPNIAETFVLLMDNDLVVYKHGIIAKAFQVLQNGYDVATIYDTIGEYKTDKLGGRNKFCPYWFAAPRKLLVKYEKVDFGDHMPHSETFGYLTEEMLKDGVRPYEFEEDKSNCLFKGTGGGSLIEYDSSGGTGTFKSKDLGYYHVRSGTLPAVLLAWREHDRPQFDKYTKEQPKTEYLRHLAWYWTLGGYKHMDQQLFKDLDVDYASWLVYVEKFKEYHGL